MSNARAIECVGVIPARYHSTRFPGKVLELIDGLPMVAHVYKRATVSQLDKVIVSTDHPAVQKAMEDLNIHVMMTAENHRSGTDRVAEVAESVSGDIFINIQGDEPYIEPEIINLLMEQFQTEPTTPMATVASTNLSDEDWNDPNIVKVQVGEDRNAVGFFRVPASQMPGDYFYKHLGIYGFKRDFLIEFAGMARSANEKSLDLEQMRALDNGIPIAVVITDLDSVGINRPEDLEKLKETEIIA